MDAERYARAGVTVAVLTVLILAGCYGISIMLGHPGESRIGSQIGTVQPDRSPPTASSPVTRRPTAHPPIVTTIGIPAPEQGVLIADLAVAGGRVLAVGSDGRLASAPVGADEARRFSLAPLRRGADRYMIQTATVAASREPDCLARTRPSGNPQPARPQSLITTESLVTAPCDAAAPAQTFQILRVGVDSTRRHLFTIRTGGWTVALDRAGNVRLVRGSGTPFCFVPWNTAEDPFDQLASSTVGRVTDEALQRARDRMRRLDQVRRLRASAMNQSSDVERELAGLRRALAAEERDVDKLERRTLTSIVAGALGTRDERLAKERAEADMARLRVDGHDARLRQLTADLAALEHELGQLADAPRRYDQALVDAERALRDTGDPRAATLTEVAIRIADITADLREYREAQQAGEAALGAVAAVLKPLGAAQGWAG